MKISSGSNDRVKQAIALREPRERRGTGMFLIEGARELRAALAAGIDVDTIFHVGPRFPDATGAHPIEVTDEVFAKMSYRDNPDGFLAIARQFDTTLTDPPAGPLTILIADRIEKPGNLGAMLRTANGAGAWVVVTDHVTDIFNPNVVRASVGTLFSTPVRVAAADDVRAWLRAHEIEVAVTSPAGTTDLFSWRAPERCAVVIGAEDVGVDDAWLVAADHTVSIPMRGSADSLNASTSAAIVLYEIARQKGAAR